MLDKLLKILFLLLTYFSYSQQVCNINFNLKGNLKIYKNNKPISGNFQTLTADVVLNSGKFSITLVDANKNNDFLNYRTIGSKIGSDIILIEDYKKRISKLDLYQARYITKAYPVIINGKTFLLSNLKKDKNNLYSGCLTQEKIPLTKFVKNKNGIRIDHLPNIKLIDLKKDTINVANLLEDNKLLYIHYYDEKNGWNFFLEPNKLKSLKTKYPNLRIISFGVVTNKSNFKRMLKEHHIKEYEIILLNNNRLEQLLKMGYNFSTSNGVLFDKKGKIICSDLNGDNLKKILSHLQNKKK